ncbi:hypothetical protein [Anaerobiospirillum thomasii]
MLKTFEEPPANTLLILVSDNYESFCQLFYQEVLKCLL